MLGCGVGLGFLVGDAAGWVLGVLPIAMLARTREPAAIVHTAWLVGLFLLTPLYHPYARLMMPLVAGGWIACGGLVAWTLARFEQCVDWRSSWRWLAGGIACCVGGVMSSGRPLAAQFEYPTLRTLRQACDELAAALPNEEVEIGRAHV